MPVRRVERLMKRLLVSRFGRWCWRHRRWVLLASFLQGAASFFLVQRQLGLAKWITGFMLLAWVLLLLEGLFNRILAPLLGWRWPQGMLRFAIQTLHQESLFFVLPFFLVTTTWSSLQAVFSALVILAAIVSIIDPLYFFGVSSRRWLYLGYHGFTLFVAVLVAGPIMLELTTGESVALACVVMALCALPSFADALHPRAWWRWGLLAVLSIGMGGGAWLGRFWIPPATLRATQVVMTTQVNTQTRSPGPAGNNFTVAQLEHGGLYAYTAISAPRGLHQGVLHVWSHNGKVVDRIPLEIEGGDQRRGYRTWSHKQHFSKHAVGRWRVTVRTDDGQLIGVKTFRVHAQKASGSAGTQPGG